MRQIICLFQTNKFQEKGTSEIGGSSPSRLGIDGVQGTSDRWDVEFFAPSWWHFKRKAEGCGGGRGMGWDAHYEFLHFSVCFSIKQNLEFCLDILCKLLRSEHNLPTTTNAFARGTTLVDPQHIGPDFFSWKCRSCLLSTCSCFLLPLFNLFFLRGKQTNEFAAKSMEIAYKTSMSCSCRIRCGQSTGMCRKLRIRVLFSPYWASGRSSLPRL